MLDFKHMQTENIMDRLSEKLISPVETFVNHISAVHSYYIGFSKYFNDFFIPYYVSTNYFSEVERQRLLKTSPVDSMQSYLDLMEFNMDITNRFMAGSLKAVNDYHNMELSNAISAAVNTMFNLEGENIHGFIERQSQIINAVTYVYPEAIKAVKSEYGFHFERDGHVKVAETDRFILYKIAPVDKSVTIDDGMKPILILPPYVLGANILAFLPYEHRSYTHSFANQGIPTYIRILKDIKTTPALQTMTAEDDCRDTQKFCEIIKKKHDKPVTLNGYCQGGFSAVCNILSGELDGLVDALLTCVSPMDGTRSVGLSAFLKNLPSRFNDLAYGSKTYPNGNKVADGDLMGWVYKLKSVENEAPLVAFYRDMMMLRPRNNNEVKIGKTAAALNYWLGYERNDLPLAITDMSFKSYNIPVTKDGVLPVKLFDRKLNFKRITEKGFKWLICYGEKDDLVEIPTALAPLDYIDVEVSAFPKGHVAIATSWSDPKSACALHTVFGDRKYRGPVRFQLDLEEELSKPKKSTRAPRKTKSTPKTTSDNTENK